MELNFKRVATFCALVFFALALTWIFVPTALLSNWGVAFSGPVGFVGRRGAALYAGVGVMLFLARNAEPSPARSALATGFVSTCLILAALGIFELVTHQASAGILSAVCIDLALAAAFWYAARNPITSTEASRRGEASIPLNKPRKQG